METRLIERLKKHMEQVNAHADAWEDQHDREHGIGKYRTAKSEAVSSAITAAFVLLMCMWAVTRYIDGSLLGMSSIGALATNILGGMIGGATVAAAISVAVAIADYWQAPR
jgi:hypothetical protein